MAKRKITYLIDVDETGAVTGTRKVEKGFDDVDKKAGKVSKNLEMYAARAGTALVAGLGLAFATAAHRAVQQGREFESQLAELEAITGITGTQLDRLGDRSLELSKKYGTSASNIIEANKLVASQLAEKIDFGTEEGFQQLQDISEQAVVLAKAAGITLSEAVNTTTSVINQFNLAADESNRVINTLAAGSKYGAAEVPAIGAALVNSGAAAASANQEIETVNAAIQVLAANGQVGERAGTALRAIFTRLKTEAQALAEAGIQNVNIESNGLVATLRQLEPLLEDTAAAKKIFGEEALNQIQILIRNADAVESLTEKVTGTNVANEQAAVNMDTFDGSLDRLVSTIDGELIPAFQANNGVMQEGIETTIGLVNATGRLIDRMNEQVGMVDRLSQGMNRNQARVQSAADTWAGWALKPLVAWGELIGTIEDADPLLKFFGEMDQAGEKIGDRINLLKTQVQQFSEQQKGLSEDSDLYQHLAKRIGEANGELDSLRQSFTLQLDALREQKIGVEKGTAAYAEINERIRLAEDALYQLAVAQDQANQSMLGGGDGGGGESAVKTLTGQLKEYKAQVEEIITSTGALTERDIDRYNQKTKEIEQIEREIELKRTLLELQRARSREWSVNIKGSENDVEAEGFNSGVPERGLSTVNPAINMIDEQMAKEMSLTELIRQENQARQELRDADTDAEITAAEAKLNMLQKIIDMQLLVSDTYQQSVMAQISSGEELLNHVLQTTKQAIKAKIAEATAEQVLKALSSVPFPFNIAAAAAAGGAISLLFEKLIPEFALGGVADGPSHAQGGMLGVIDGKPAFEFEGGEAIINKRSTRMFLPELNAINRAGGGVPLAENGAVTMNMIPRGSAGDLPLVGGGGGDLQSVLGELTQVLKSGIRADMNVAELNERLNDYNDFQTEVGN